MTDDELAEVIAASIANRQTRGLIYRDPATGETVVHGRVDMTAVAEDVIGVVTAVQARRSWAPWFVCAAQMRRRRTVRAGRLAEEAALAEAALARLRSRAESES